MSAHTNGDDILDVIFNKVQLVDVKFNGSSEVLSCTPTIAARMPLSQNQHCGEHLSLEVVNKEELSARNGKHESVSNISAEGNQEQTNGFGEEVTSTPSLDTQESGDENGYKISSTRQSSRTSMLDCQTDMSIGTSEWGSPSTDCYQSLSHDIHFEKGISDSDRSSMVTPNPSLDTNFVGKAFSPSLTHSSTEDDLIMEELNHQQSQTNSAQASYNSEPETLPNTADQSTELNLEQEDQTLEVSEQEGSEEGTGLSAIDHKNQEKVQKDEFQKDLATTLRKMNNKEVGGQLQDRGKRPPKGLQPLNLNYDRGEQLESPLSSGSYRTLELTSPNEKYREIKVRTSLHESVSKAYSSFEPDKQELIRQEIGQTTNIRHLLHRFQDPQQLTENKLGLSSATVKAYPRIHFQLPPISIQEVDGNQPKKPIVRTPHPVAMSRHSTHPLKIFSEPEVILEEQKSVSELLSKFGVGQKVKMRKVVSPAKLSETPNVVLRKAEKGTKPAPFQYNRHSEGMKKTFEAKIGKGNGDGHPPPPSYYTFWCGNKALAKSNRFSEPPLGSLAAIQKSLSSLPNSPITSPLPPVRSPESKTEVKHFFGHNSPKNVRDFYRVWGNKPDNHGHTIDKLVNTSHGSRTQQAEDHY